MIATTIRQVKKEIRVLGIAIERSGKTDRFHVVGVVYRGRLWLDGVMSTVVNETDITGDIVEMIKRSPHHPQIRVALLSDALTNGATIDPYELSLGISKPVIAIKSCGGQKKFHVNEVGQRLELKSDGATLAAMCYGLRSHEADRVLRVSTREGVLPEALRVAGLVVMAVAAIVDQKI
jgi:endonuclease V-like protein UPF0215 family